MNPNRCETCDYKKINGNRDGHCYAFRDEPSDGCMQHTGRKISLADFLPDERECCGTFQGTAHRSTCEKYRGKK